ncbi:MAG: flagellin, partial [Rubrivivax sp.]
AGEVSDLSAITDGSIALSVGGATVSLGDIAAARSGEERLGQVVEAINRRTADTGVSAFLKANTDGSYALEVRSSELDASGSAVAVTAAGFTVANAGFDAADLAIANAATTSAAGIEDLSVATVEDAWLALKQVDDALDQINGARATLGAVQSRFENAVSNIMIQSENTAAARGRIMDADFAAETANLSRAQILQQAGTAMVAQANALPQQVLQLLRS